MLIWISIVLLADAALALWHEERLQKLLPNWRIRIYALIEAGLALALAGLHFWRGR